MMSRNRLLTISDSNGNDYYMKYNIEFLYQNADSSDWHARVLTALSVLFFFSEDTQKLLPFLFLTMTRNSLHFNQTWTKNTMYHEQVIATTY